MPAYKKALHSYQLSHTVWNERWVPVVLASVVTLGHAPFATAQTKANLLRGEYGRYREEE
jgi:hypothetical protein